MIAGVLVALLLVAGSPACLAGEGYLDRSKVREAVPYGTTIEPPAAKRAPAPAAGRDRDTGQPSVTTSSTNPSESTPNDRGRGPDRR